MCRQCLVQILTLITGCKELHYIEENYKVPKRKTKIGAGEVICSTTQSASAVVKYREMCVRYYEEFDWKSREGSKKAMDYTGNDH
jgi:hypothetical protein